MIIDSTKAPMTQNRCYQQCFLSDNLDLMKTIESDTIDLIYCDILYGTGRNFGDYQDLKPIRSEIESHYLPRLKEMHRILKPTGSIYLHCDWHINHWIRDLMDRVFGYDKFVNELIWYYTIPSSSKKMFNRAHSNIYFYSKTHKRTFNDKDVRIPYKDGLHGGNFGKVTEERIALGKISESWWNFPQVKVLVKENCGYPTQKPKALIERIIKASSNEGDLVADFYLGSGTTAEVCKDLNRNFIGCDINARAIEITLQRLNDARS